jgi:hypothetical protein
MLRLLPLLCTLLASAAQAVAPHTYSTSWFPSPVDSFEASLVWEDVPKLSNRFVATQFGLEGGVGVGGYVGLQQLWDGSTKAIFSLWGATPVSPACDFVIELGVEVSRCFIDYPWELGEHYKLRVERIMTFNNTHWYAAWVTDEDGKDTLIGVHSVPGTVTAVTPWLTYFVELFGESECEGHERTAVTFFPPTANAGTVSDLPSLRDHGAACEQGAVREGYVHESGE